MLLAAATLIRRDIEEQRRATRCHGAPPCRHDDNMSYAPRFIAADDATLRHATLAPPLIARHAPLMLPLYAATCRLFYATSATLHCH